MWFIAHHSVWEESYLADWSVHHSCMTAGELTVCQEVCSSSVQDLGDQVLPSSYHQTVVMSR